MQNVAPLQIPKLELLGMVSVVSTCLCAREEGMDAFAMLLDVSGASPFPPFLFWDFVAMVQQALLALVPVPEALVLEQLASQRRR